MAPIIYFNNVVIFSVNPPQGDIPSWIRPRELDQFNVQLGRLWNTVSFSVMDTLEQYTWHHSTQTQNLLDGLKDRYFTGATRVFEQVDSYDDEGDERDSDDVYEEVLESPLWDSAISNSEARELLRRMRLATNTMHAR